MDQPANILFITADQWRGDCLSALGHPCVKTPHLDALAADGLLFKAHYTQATPCGPARASLYTGMYLHNHRSVINGTPLDSRHSNVALEARKAGYEPALFGYTDVSPDPRSYPPGDPVLTSYEGLLPGMTPVVMLKDDNLAWLADLVSKGYEVSLDHHEVFQPRRDAPGASERGPTWAPALYRAEDSNTAFLTSEAIKYISVRGNRPWFIHLSYLSPHPPFLAPEPYNDLYDPDAVPMPVRAESAEAEAAQHPWLDFWVFNQRGDGPSRGVSARDYCRISERDLRQTRATYYGMMSEVDAQVGRLIAHLKETGAYERTLIVFTTDHGEQLGDHWMFSKYGWFDSAFRIPLILRVPEASEAKTAGRVIDAFTESVDVMPTILDWLGLEAPAQCDGMSLLPFSRGESPVNWREEAHWEFDFRNRVGEMAEQGLQLTPDQSALSVIRGRRYKYVHFTALPPLFYDLERDPGEFVNRADDPDYRELVLDYAQRMLSWRMNHDERVLANHWVTPEGVKVHSGPRR